MNNRQKILLIDPPWYRLLGQQSSAKPLGLCSLAAILDKEGYEVKVYNTDIEPGAGVKSSFDVEASFKQYLLRSEDLNDPLWQTIKQTIKNFQPTVIGMSVLTAWAAGKFDAELIAKSVKEFNVEEKIDNKRIVLPGHVAVLSGELEEELPDWQIMVGPREAVDIPQFINQVL